MMTRFVAMGVLGAALLAWSALPGGAEETQRERSGEELYRQYCGACHGINADGKGPVAPVLSSPPADLTRIASRRDGVFPEAAVIRIIDGRDPIVSHGPQDMPVWGERFAEGIPPSVGAEVAARGHAILLVEYLKSIQVAGGGADGS